MSLAQSFRHTHLSWREVMSARYKDPGLPPYENTVLYCTVCTYCISGNSRRHAGLNFRSLRPSHLRAAVSAPGASAQPTTELRLSDR